ncbi:MAG: hypothetical protein KF802_12635 [Bdellovibrionaceae bacterium]|nr:hypothetical protein [Pseudobdellovibrionaceae bacterium]MBX3034818.1 hypothetical protein [Pseudobdellovibrionaceae bacterium]
MRQMKIMLTVTMMVAGSMNASAAEESPERILETRLQQSRQQSEQGARVVPGAAKTLLALRGLAADPEARAKPCAETSWVTFGGRYALSVEADTETATRKFCRIYDLSFPTLRTLFGKPVSKLPVERLSARDYLNWAEGKYDRVYNKLEEAKKNFEPSRAVRASWIAGIPFSDSPAGLKAQSLRSAGQLPLTFRASDLQVGDFRLSDRDRAQVRQLFAEAKTANGGLSPQMTAMENMWDELSVRPKSFLEKIRFDWNDAEKVYEIFLEAQFLPINGPVALVDYNAQYKPAVEAMLRSVVNSVLRSLAQAIPHPVARNLVTIAVDDGFQFVEMTYNYQMNQLEGVLRAGLNQEARIDADLLKVQQGMNILFGSRSNLLVEYIMALAQGKKFSWEEIDKIGRTARYRAEKARDISMNNMNSRLVLRDHCSMELVHGYFGICTKKGVKDSLRSLISTRVSFYWNWGPPVIHRYELPAEATLLRSTSWLLSAAVRVFEMPLPAFLTNELSKQLKTFATSGMTDEAFLKSSLLVQQASRPLAPEDQNMMKWLYIQNINPFLPHTAGAEQKIIEANARLLGLKAL